MDKYYLGSTTDLRKRLLDHNKGRSRYTRIGRPWRVVYYEEFESYKEARKREIEVKRKKSRRYLEWLIEMKNG